MSMIAKGSWSALLIALAMTWAVVAQAQAPIQKAARRKSALAKR